MSAKTHPRLVGAFVLGAIALGVAAVVFFSAGGWFEKREDFVGPLLVESPNVFLDPATTGQYIAAVLGQAGVPPQQIGALAPLLTCVLTGVKAPGCTQPGVPLVTVVPNSDLTQNADMFLTYRNFGAVDLWGLDLSATYLIGNEWSIAGAYSHVNKDFFTAQEVEGPTDVALNAPMNKGALSVERGPLSYSLKIEERWKKYGANPAWPGASTITTVDREAVVTRTSIGAICRRGWCGDSP